MNLNEIQIGGRNYLLDSDKYITAPESMMYFEPTDVESYRGRIMTLSVFVELINGTAGNMGRIGYEPAFKFEDGSIQYFRCWYNLSQGPNFRGRISATFEVPDKQIIEIVQNHIAIQLNGTFTKVGRPQLELGNIPTDWMPAIEDLAKKSDISRNTLTTDRIFVQSTQPSNPQEGDIWFKR